MYVANYLFDLLDIVRLAKLSVCYPGHTLSTLDVLGNLSKWLFSYPTLQLLFTAISAIFWWDTVTNPVVMIDKVSTDFHCESRGHTTI